jgi:hypothetical protein
MKTEMSVCNNCGAPLPLPENMLPKSCRFCRHQFGEHWEPMDVRFLSPRISALNALDIVKKEMKRKEVSRTFLNNASLERSVLYYIPILEFGGNQSTAPFDSSIAENTIRTSELLPFDPIEMRKTGVVVPLPHLHILLKKTQSKSRESMGHSRKLIYFPVWEVVYRFRGIVFKSYVSAYDGIPLKIQALRNHKKKSALSLLGLLALAVLLGRGANTGGGALMLSAIFVLPVSAILFPYFWELFAFLEIVEIQGETVNFKEINYPENSFKNSFKRLFKKRT